MFDYRKVCVQTRLIMWQRRNYRHVLHSSVFWTFNLLVAAKHPSFVQRTFSRKAEHDILLSISYWYKSWFHAQKSLNHYGTHSDFSIQKKIERIPGVAEQGDGGIPTMAANIPFKNPSIFIWLVVWNMNFICPFSWEFHHPNWRSPSFFRGVGQPPTSIITITIH